MQVHKFTPKWSKCVTVCLTISFISKPLKFITMSLQHRKTHLENLTAQFYEITSLTSVIHKPHQTMAVQQMGQVPVN